MHLHQHPQSDALRDVLDDWSEQFEDCDVLRRLHQPTPGNLQRVLNDSPRNVDASRIDAVAELHRRVDLIHKQAALRVLEQIDRKDAPTDGTRGPGAEVSNSPALPGNCWRCLHEQCS